MPRKSTDSPRFSAPRSGSSVTAITEGEPALRARRADGADEKIDLHQASVRAAGAGLTQTKETDRQYP